LLRHTNKTHKLYEIGKAMIFKEFIIKLSQVGYIASKMIDLIKLFLNIYDTCNCIK